MEKNNGSEYVLHGDLSIKGVTKRIKLHVGFNGIVKDPWGGKRAAFEVSGKISRKDFGLSFNMMLDGRFVVSDEVQIMIEGELVERAEAPADPATA